MEIFASNSIIRRCQTLIAPSILGIGKLITFLVLWAFFYSFIHLCSLLKNSINFPNFAVLYPPPFFVLKIEENSIFDPLYKKQNLLVLRILIFVYQNTLFKDSQRNRNCQILFQRSLCPHPSKFGVYAFRSKSK